MSDYTKATNFATKDSLPTGNPAKIVKGTEINDEFESIEVAVNSKANIVSPTFEGDPKSNATLAAADNDTSLATTEFVKTVISSGGYVTSGGIADNNVTADELNVDGDGASGNFLISDGDGSFSWTELEFGADRQTFTEDGTWTKPSTGNIAIVELWGAGGGGGSASSSLSVLGGGGGGGGSYARYEFLLSELGATETVTIGQGGAGSSAGSSAGSNGGNTTFGTHATGYGGGGGGYPAYAEYVGGNGGGGGGLTSAGGNGGSGTSYTGTGGGPVEGPYMNIYGGGGGAIGENSNYSDLVHATYGGGGGGAASGSAGNSVYGGGAGASGHNSTTIGGGGSVYGGGGGSCVSGTGGDGSYPAGGGAGSGQGIAGGAGADGKCVITVY